MPSVTVPIPLRDVIDAPAVVPEISSVPLSVPPDRATQPVHGECENRAATDRRCAGVRVCAQQRFSPARQREAVAAGDRAAECAVRVRERQRLTAERNAAAHARDRRAVRRARISNVPLSVTLLDCAMLLAPLSIVVAPEYRLIGGNNDGARLDLSM
jgi:hypothetical protein